MSMYLYKYTPILYTKHIIMHPQIWPQRRFWATTFAGHCCSGCTMMAKLQRCLAELANCGQGIPFLPRPILFWAELTGLFHFTPQQKHSLVNKIAQHLLTN